MRCFYQANLCPAPYTKLQHTSISIPRYLPVNTDFLQLQPYIPPSGSSFERLPCYCVTYFYPVQNSDHLFGVYQIGQVGIIYNRVVFDEPGFYEFEVVSDYLNGYGSIVSRTTFHVFLDVANYMFWRCSPINAIIVFVDFRWLFKNMFRLRYECLYLRFNCSNFGVLWCYYDDVIMSYEVQKFGFLFDNQCQYSCFQII